jgi:hypothetical protein
MVAGIDVMLQGISMRCGRLRSKAMHSALFVLTAVRRLQSDLPIGRRYAVPANYWYQYFALRPEICSGGWHEICKSAVPAEIKGPLAMARGGNTTVSISSKGRGRVVGKRSA